MTKKLHAIVSLAIALIGCALDEDASDPAAVAPSEEQPVEIEGKTQLLMPPVNVTYDLVNLASSRRVNDLLMEHVSSSTGVTATVRNLSDQYKRDVVIVQVKTIAVCQNSSGVQKHVPSTRLSPPITWQFPNFFSVAATCPSGYSVVSKRSEFTVKEKFVAPT